MKALVLLGFIIALSGCSRVDSWSVAAVRNLSDDVYRKLRVEVVTEGSIPWPLRLSVSAVDTAKNRIESTLPRWTAKQVGPHRVAFDFAEPISPKTRACVLDLKISAKGYSTLHVHQILPER